MVEHLYFKKYLFRPVSLQEPKKTNRQGGLIMEYRSSIFKKRYKNFILVSTIPVVTFYVIFMIFPIVQSLYYSLFKWSGFSAEKEYIGLENYGELIGDSLFLETVVNSFQYVVF